MKSTLLCQQLNHRRCSDAELACGCTCHRRATPPAPAPPKVEPTPRPQGAAKPAPTRVVTEEVSPLHCPRCHGTTHRVTTSRGATAAKVERCQTEGCGWTLPLSNPYEVI